MRRALLFVHFRFLALLVAFLFLATPQAQAQSPDDAFEQAILDHLATINPDAVAIFQEATRAQQANDLPAARRGFMQVLALAPGFPDALRRLSYVEVDLGDSQSALSHAREAQAVEDSAHNRAAVARSLLATEDESHLAEALTLAKSATEELPDSVFAHFILLDASVRNEDLAAIHQASSRLVQLAPDEPYPHFFLGLVHAEDGKWEQAEKELLLSRDLGMEAEAVEQALDDGIARQARLYRSLRYIAFAIGIWLLGLALLFLIGWLLSTATLAAVKRPARTIEYQLNPFERTMRTLYAVVIALTSAYFYLSIPILILIVAGGTIGLLYLMLRASRIVPQLFAFVAIVGLYTTVAILRSIFTRLTEGEPGRPLTRSEASQLWAMAEEVAQRVDTRPLDAIYVTPAVEVAVTERGRLIKKLRGQGQRSLILGLGTLPGMTQGEFKAILAHEYGHFSNRDTAGGNLAHQVRASMHHLAYRLAERGLARWYNPAWLFVNGFNRVFLRITLGASRLQEILADRHAAVAYGIRNLTDGLTRIVRLNLVFDFQVNREVQMAVARGRSLHNLYALEPVVIPEERETLEKRFDEVMNRPTSAYDSHPAVHDRIQLLAPFASETDVTDSQEPLIDLIPNLSGLQEEMTAVVQGNVDKQQANNRAARAAFERQQAKKTLPEIRPYRAALAVAFESGDADAQAEALQDLGDAYSRLSLPQNALACYQEALASYRGRNDQEGERVARFNIAMIHKEIGDLQEAEEGLLAVVALDEACASPDLASDRGILSDVQRLRKALEAQQTRH